MRKICRQNRHGCWHRQSNVKKSFDIFLLYLCNRFFLVLDVLYERNCSTKGVAHVPHSFALIKNSSAVTSNSYFFIFMSLANLSILIGGIDAGNVLISLSFPNIFKLEDLIFASSLYSTIKGLCIISTKSSLIITLESSEEKSTKRTSSLDHLTVICLLLRVLVDPLICHLFKNVPCNEWYMYLLLFGLIGSIRKIN